MVVWRDGAYFQYFQGVVSGIDIATTVQAVSDTWWSALVSRTVGKIEAAIRGGFVSNDNPTDAVAIPLSGLEVQRAMDDSPPLKMGDVVGNFDAA